MVGVGLYRRAVGKGTHERRGWSAVPPAPRDPSYVVGEAWRQQDGGRRSAGGGGGAAAAAEEKATRERGKGGTEVRGAHRVRGESERSRERHSHPAQRRDHDPGAGATCHVTMSLCLIKCAQDPVGLKSRLYLFQRAPRLGENSGPPGPSRKAAFRLPQLLGVQTGGLEGGAPSSALRPTPPPGASLCALGLAQKTSPGSQPWPRAPGVSRP